MAKIGEKINQAELDSLQEKANKKLLPIGEYDFRFDFSEGTTNLLHQLCYLSARVNAKLRGKALSDANPNVPIISDKQVVGINPNRLPVQWVTLEDKLKPISSQAGRLFLSDGVAGSTSYNKFFRDIEFRYAATYANEGLASSGQSSGGLSPASSVPPRINQKIGYLISDRMDVYGVADNSNPDDMFQSNGPFSFSKDLKWSVPTESKFEVIIWVPIKWIDRDSPQGIPSESDFIVSTTFGTATHSVIQEKVIDGIHYDVVTEHGIGNSLYFLECKIKGTFSGSGSLHWGVTNKIAGASWGFGLGAIDGHTWWSTPTNANSSKHWKTSINGGVADIHAIYYAYITPNIAGTSPQPATIIHPDEGRTISPGPEINPCNFILNDTIRGEYFLELTTPFLRGCWCAKTKPVPAINTYLDQCFAPYIDKIDANYYAVKKPMRNVFPQDGLSFDRDLIKSSLKKRAPIPGNSISGIPINDIFANDYGETKVIELVDGAEYVVNRLMPDNTALEFQIKKNILTCMPTDAYGSPVVEAIRVLISDRAIDSANPTTYDIEKEQSGAGISVGFDEVRTQYFTDESGNSIDVIGGKQISYLIKNISGATIFIYTAVLREYAKVIIYPVEPCCGSLSSVWPVIRDTDQYPVFPCDIGLTGNGGLDVFRTKGAIYNEDIPPMSNSKDLVGGFSFTRSIMFSSYLKNPLTGEYYDSFKRGKIDFGNPNIEIVVSDLDATPVIEKKFLGGAVTVEQLKEAFPPTVPDVFPQEGDQILYRNLWFKAFNPTESTENINVVYYEEFTNYKGYIEKKPIMIPWKSLTMSAPEFDRGAYEAFSFNLLTHYAITSDVRADIKNIPMRGYCIYNIRVRRCPVEKIAEKDGRPSVLMPKTDGLSPLIVKVGLQRGIRHTDFTDIDKGTFTSLIDIDIPEGEIEASVDVFWPVVHGMYLSYQCSEQVWVEAAVNFQPIFHSKQYALPSINSSVFLDDTRKYPIHFEGSQANQPAQYFGEVPYPENPDSAYGIGLRQPDGFSRFMNHYSENKDVFWDNFYKDYSNKQLWGDLYFMSSVSFPISAAQINDLNNGLDLLPDVTS